MRFFLAALFLPVAAFGQLTLATVDCTTGTPINSGSVFDFGPVAAGAIKTVTFLGCNPGNTAVNVTTILVAGDGFVLSGAPTTYLDPPQNALPLRFSVQFSATALASYSASLQVNSINIFLLATVVPALTLSVGPPCTFTGTQINFGSVSAGKTAACNFLLSAASTIAVTGSGFQLASASGPVQQFSVQLDPVCGTTNYSGTLTLGVQSYSLSGTGFLPPLPTPVFTFDENTFGSGQQHTLAISLPSAYPCAGVVKGYVNLAFTPASGLHPDSSVVFVSGNTPEAAFTLEAGGMQFLFAGQFNTGSTAGSIAFSVSANGLDIAGDHTTIITIPPATVFLDRATASNQVLGQLNISLTGYDNTYSTGAMSFAFYDASGNPIGSPIDANFTSNFSTFFSAQATGSTFLALVSFPVTGPQTQVASVAVTLTNAAGQAQTGKLTFQ